MVDKKTVEIKEKDNPAFGQVMLITKEFEFSAAHKLKGNLGEPLHGHNYKMSITCMGKVNKDGIVQDFRTMKDVVNSAVIQRLDHSFLNDLLVQPTLENLAVWIWNELVDMSLYEIRLWESESSSITYRGPKFG